MKAKFYKQKVFLGFVIEGHAGLAPAGEDILCAAVSSAVQMTVNGITEVLKAPADLSVKESRISLKLKQDDEAAGSMIESLWLQLNLLAEEYQGYIDLSIEEE